MKKKFVAPKLLYLFGTFPLFAFGQSNIQIYGNLDQSLYHMSQNGKYLTTTASNSNTSSYWGIAGAEDLGNGLKASFDLRSELTLMTGQAASTTSSATGANSTLAVTQLDVTNAADKPSFFNRAAYVNIESNSIGALKIGRQEDVWFAQTGLVNNTGMASLGFGTTSALQLNSANLKLVSGIASPTSITSFAGFGNNNPMAIGVAENFVGAITYTTPIINGIKAAYQIGTPKVSYNTAGNSNNGYAYALSYDNVKDLTLRIASSVKFDTNGTNQWENDLIGGTYKLDRYTLIYAQNKTKFGGLATGYPSLTSIGYGINYIISSSLDVNAAYTTLVQDSNNNNKVAITAFTGKFKLSPRTSVYLGIGKANNSGASLVGPIFGGAASDGTNMATSVLITGIRHTF
jgi:predicted porin